MPPTLRSRSRAVTPVFVDGSGRRLRRVRIALITAGALAAAYTVLVVISLFGVPTVASPFLAQPRHPAVSTPTPSPASSHPSAARDSAGTRTPATQNGGLAPVTVANTTARVPAPSATPAPTAAASPAPAPSPTATPPGKSGSAPGKTKTHPTPKPSAHPTPPSHS